MCEKKLEWNWNHTALHNDEHTTLKVSEIKQLLINRGENKKETNGTKINLIKKLKEKYSVKLNKPFTKLTGKQLLIELKLRCLSCKSCKKQQLIERLTNAIPIIQQIQSNEPSETYSIQIPWQYTEYKILDLKYLQQLLINRHINESEINGNKQELIKILKENHTVKLTEPIHHFNCNAIKTELLLYGNIFYGNTLKSVLIQQYKQQLAHHTQCKDWIYLNKHSDRYDTFMSDMFMINNNEFIISGDQYIKTYNIKTNEWNDLMIYKTEKKLYYSWEDTSAACIDTNNNLMYVYYCTQDNKKQRLFIINYKTKVIIKRMMKNLPIVHMPAKLMFVYKQLHLIGDNKHWIFDNKKRKFNLCHTFELLNNMNNFVFMNIISKNKIIMLMYDNKSFYEYNILNHKWSKKLKLKSKLLISGKDCCVVTGNEQYGILFGGNDLNIFVIDLNTMKLYESKIKCVTIPSNGYRTVIAYSQGNKLKQELIAFGYVRNYFNIMDIGMNMFPPYYIIKMIEEYCTDEFLHVVERNGWHSYKQRKIRVTDIINNLI